MQPTSIPTGTLTPAQIAQGRASVNSTIAPSSPQNATIDWSQIPGAKENTNQPQTIQGNLENTFNQGASNIESDIGNVQSNAQKAGGSPLAYAAAGGAAAGHVAGDIAGTAGGILGSFIAPLLPEAIKNSVGDATNYVAQKVNQIPGMTPDIARSLGDLFNTGSLALGANVEEPAVNAVKSGANAVGDTLTQGVEGIKNAVSNIGKGNVEAATTAREIASQQAVSSVKNIHSSVGDFKSDLGTSFREGAQNIEKTNPNLKLALTPEQELSLSQLKDTKSFALPDYLKTTNTPEDISDIQTSHQLSPTQAQDLITQLNNSTFSDRVSGLGVDQSKIGLTNEIKSAASKAFGSDWDKVYGDYAKGKDALDKISDIVKFNKNSTASDFNKSLKRINQLSSTPEGKSLLNEQIDEFKNQTDVDLRKDIETVRNTAAKDADLQKAIKGGFFKQNSKYFTRRIVTTGGLSLIGVSALAAALRKAL